MARKSLSAPLSPVDEDQIASDPDGVHIALTGYSPYGISLPVTQPEIIRSLQALQIEPDVISRGCAVFYRLNNDSKIKSIKGRRKQRMMFFCLLIAYNELDYPVDPCYAADLVTLPRTEIEKTMNECSPSEMIVFDPIKMIKFYMHRFNILLSTTGVQYDSVTVIKEVTEVIEVCKKTQSGREWIQNTAAKIVAVTALYFYLNDIKNFDISKHSKFFEEACYLSSACIRRYHPEIIRYYNMDVQTGQHASPVSVPFL